MPDLIIDGKEITVGDEFLKLSRQEQNQTVDEIRAQMRQMEEPEENVIDTSKPPQEANSLGLDSVNMPSMLNDMAGRWLRNRRENPNAIESASDALAQGAASGITGGYDDEARALLASNLGSGETFDEAHGRIAGNKREIQDRNPVLSTVGEVAGGLALGGGLAKAGVNLAARPVLTGAGMGALYGSGNADEGSRLEGAAMGAAVGGLTAGVLDKTFKGASKLYSKSKGNVPAAMSTQELGDAAGAAFREADDIGARLKTSTVRNMVNRMKAKISIADLDDELEKRTLRLVSQMDDWDTTISTSKFHNMRRRIGAALDKAESTDAYTLRLLKGEIDDVLDNITPGDVVGNGRQKVMGFKKLKEGIQLYKRKSESEFVETLIAKAIRDGEGQYTQAGVAHTIAREFRKAANNPKVMKRFSKEAQEHIEKIGKGQFTPAAVRWLAKAAPRGIVSSALSGGIGFGVGGPIGGVALPAAGWAAAKESDRAAMAAANAFRDNIARGTIPRVSNVPSQAPLNIMSGQFGGNIGG